MMKIKKRISHLLLLIIAFLSAIGFSEAKVTPISLSDWNNNPDSFWYSKSCDETMWNTIYSGDYKLVLDNFHNGNSYPVYIHGYKILTTGNHILYNNSYHPNAGSGMLIFNYYTLLGINGKVNPGQTIRHLTTAEEVQHGATFNWDRQFVSPFYASLDNTQFNVPNYRSDGTHPSTPTATGGNSQDAEFRVLTLYSKNTNLNTPNKNYVLVECFKTVIRWCGDGILDAEHEQCDPNLQSSIPSGSQCSNSCELITPQAPQCNSAYSGDHYMNNPAYSGWLSSGTPDLCSVGTLKPNSFTTRWSGSGHAGHYSWRCITTGGEKYCQANQYRCGDGLKTNGETCDEGPLNGTPGHCNSACTGIIQQPQCGSQYHGQYEYTYGTGYPWINSSTPGLCANGSRVTNFSGRWYGSGNSAHYTWNCSLGGNNTTGCSVQQRWCGDGKVTNNEACDEATLNGTPGHCNSTCTGQVPPTSYCGDGNLDAGEQCDPGNGNFGNGCATGCTLMEPSCTLTVTPNSGVAPLDTNINATKSGWAIFTGLILGDGTPVITNPQFELQHRYNTVGSFTLILGVKNNYTGSIAAGVTRPTANCTAVVNTTSPGAPIPNIVKKQKTGGMSNFTTDQITVDAGQQITYRVYFGNSGNVAATGEVRDILPPCVDYVSSTISLPAGVDANGPITGTWNNQDTVRYKDFRLGANKGGYMTIVAYIRGTGYHGTTNCANVTSYVNTGYFKFVGSGTLSSQVIAVRPQTPPTPGTPILTIDKEQLTTGNLTAGDYVAYKITVRNIGSGTATGVTIYDLLPRELQYISSSITVPNYSSYLFTTGTIGGGSLQRTYIRYYNITLKKNGTATVYLTGKVKNGYTFDTLTNCATVSGSNLQPIEDCETWNPPTPPTAPHLTIDKELLTTGPLSAGSTVAYKITLTNDGNATYYNAYILDIIPSAIQYQTSRIVNISNYLFSEGATGDNEYFIKYYNFNLNPGRSAIVYLTGVLKEGFNFNYTTNCAFTSGGNSCVLLSVGPVPFVQKWQQLGNTTSLHGNWTTGVLTVEPGNFISYRIDFGNSGTSGAYGVVKDILPECVEYFTGKLIGATGIGPNYNSTTNTVQFSSVYLATGTTAHMMVVGKIKQGGHCQSVTGYLNTGAFKFNSTDWEYSTVLAIRTGNPGNDINVTIQKTVDKSYVIPGDTVIYTISYTNEGPDTLTSYTIRDYWPTDKLDFIEVLEPDTPTHTWETNSIIKRVFNNQEFVQGETRQIKIKGQVKP